VEAIAIRSRKDLASDIDRSGKVPLVMVLLYSLGERSWDLAGAGFRLLSIWLWHLLSQSVCSLRHATHLPNRQWNYPASIALLTT